MTNKSIRYEFDFIHYLNNKKLSELSEKWQKHLKRMFPEIKEDTTATSRCMPFANNEPISNKCVCCGKEAKHLVIWGKAY